MNQKYALESKNSYSSHHDVPQVKRGPMHLHQFIIKAPIQQEQPLSLEYNTGPVYFYWEIANILEVSGLNISISTAISLYPASLIREKFVKIACSVESGKLPGHRNKTTIYLQQALK